MERLNRYQHIVGKPHEIIKEILSLLLRNPRSKPVLVVLTFSHVNEGLFRGAIPT
jgi:hypothetical protein